MDARLATTALSSAGDKIVSGVHSLSTDIRALLVGDVFQRFIEVRLEFVSILERCVLKGWPDRSAAIRSSTRLQQLYYQRLAVRLKHLVVNTAPDNSGWDDYTTTEKVHLRVQEGWGEAEEQGLISCDEAYAQLQYEILKVEATTDPQTLEEPFAMAKRDPEVHSAWSKLNSTVLTLDRELDLEPI